MRDEECGVGERVPLRTCLALWDGHQMTRATRPGRPPSLFCLVSLPPVHSKHCKRLTSWPTRWTSTARKTRSTNEWNGLALFCWFSSIPIAIGSHCHWNPARKKERKWTPRGRGGHPAPPPGALSYLRYPSLQKLSHSTNYPS